MGLFAELKRSSKKTKLMLEATKSEIYRVDVEKTRKELYDFLSSDYIIGNIIHDNDVTYDDFGKMISVMRAWGLSTSKHGDFIPIASLCFAQTLEIALEYFKKKTVGFDSVAYRLQCWFDER